MDQEIKAVEDVTETNETQNTEPKAQKTNDKKRPAIRKGVLFIALVLVLMFASAAGAYYWRDNQANNTEKLQSDNIDRYVKTIAAYKAQQDKEVVDEDDATTPCTETAPSAATIANIKASITSGNTAALEGYMATSVNVILAATEAYGPQTRVQAVGDISTFISDDIDSWDYNFTLPAATLDSYQADDYAQYFPDNAIVGKASNNKVISFSFDCTGKIDTVFLAGDASLL